MLLRPYQKKLIDGARNVLSTHRSVLCQAPTGSGKTVNFSSITSRAMHLGHRVWIVVPRNELLKQASEHLLKHNVPHGLISASTNESRAYQVHVVSKDTLIRRYDKIKHWPDLLIMDEAHLYLDRQIEIFSHVPEHTKLIGFTATPERLDGRGLSTASGGLYDDIVLGPSIAELIDDNFLSPMRYFCPPIEGLMELHRRGTEFNADEVEELLQRRKVYGSAIQNYREHAHNKPALVFCRSIKAAAETAERFNKDGYAAENIDGKMSYARRQALIGALKTGRLKVLTSCELITYGLDVPIVEAIIMLRPTLSRTLYFQMIGRGLRMSPGKKHCTILDHVGNLQEHGHPLEPYKWQFHGRDKRTGTKGVSRSVLHLCCECFLYFKDSDVCPYCGGVRKPKKRADVVEIEGRLIEVEGPVPYKDRPKQEQQQITERVDELCQSCQLLPDEDGLLKIDESAVAELIAIAESLGHDAKWVYHRVSAGKMAVNVPLLHAIGKVKGYKPGWVHYQRTEMNKRNAGAKKMAGIN